MAETSSYVVRALDTSTWSDFAAMVERNSGLFSGCWCVYFHHGVPDGRGEDEDNRSFKERMVRAGVAHAALVYVGDGDDAEAVAWAEYGSPAELPNIHHRKQYDAESAASSVAAPTYRVTCINVDKRHRRRGLARVALDGAVDLVARAGGGVVEGYPQDLTHHDPAKKISANFIYNGTRHLYEEAGFTYVRPKGKNHCVMSRIVEPA